MESDLTLMDVETEQKPPRIHSPNGGAPVSERNAQLLEGMWTRAQNEPDFLLVLKGTDDQQAAQFEVVKTWAATRNPKVNIRRYTHPSLPSDATYLRMFPYLPRRRS